MRLFIMIAGQRFRVDQNANTRFQEAHFVHTASEAVSFCLTCTIEVLTADALVAYEARSQGNP